MAVVQLGYVPFVTCDCGYVADGSDLAGDHREQMDVLERQVLGLDGHRSSCFDIVGFTFEIITIVDGVIGIGHVFWEDADEFMGKDAWPMSEDYPAYDDGDPGPTWRRPIPLELEWIPDTVKARA